MKRIAAVLLLLLAAPMAGYARTEPVRAYEGDISTPYKSIGTLEVKKKISGGVVGNSLKVLTLGIYPSRSAEAQKKALKAMLVKKASKHYEANAVINVHYWPNPESGSFPEGFIYARGEMVRYEHFPSKS